MVNAVMLAVFWRFVAVDNADSERLARLQEPDLLKKGRAIYPPCNAGLVPVFYFQWQYCGLFTTLYGKYALVDSLERYQLLYLPDRFPGLQGNVADTS